MITKYSFSFRLYMKAIWFLFSFIGKTENPFTIMLEPDTVMSLHPIMLSILIILISYALIYMFKKLINKSADRSNIKLNLPPSPPKIPIFGNIHQLTPILHQCFHRMSAKYGPLMLLNLGEKRILVVSSTEMATQIVKTHDLIFADRLSTKAAKIMFFDGNNISLAPYGEQWRQLRKFCVLELLSTKRVQSFKYVREEEIYKVVEKMANSSRKGEVINLSETLFTMSNSIIARCSLGDNFNKDYTERFLKLIKNATALLESFSFGDFIPWLKWMDIVSGLNRKLRRTSQELDAFFNQIIDDHHLLNSEVDGSHDHDKDDKRNFIDLLVHHAKKDNLSLTRNAMKGIIMDMFVGGSDTSPTAIEWAMAELITNPKLMKKAQEEVRRVVGNKTKVEEDDINQMDYLKCIVKESLRLHPPLPNLISRNSTANVNIGGYDIPRDTGVFLNVWTIQRDPNLWDKPEEFCPERFENNPMDLKGQDFQFIPFGAGRRGCPGISFGLAVVEFALANLLYNFDWELPDGANDEELDMTEGFGITVNRKVPLQVVPKLFRSASS